MFQSNPGVLVHKPFDGKTLMDFGIIEDHENQRLGKAMVGLVEKVDKQLRRATWCSFPIKLLCVEVERPEEDSTLALVRAGNFGFVPLAKPAALDTGRIGPVRYIAK